MDRPRILKPAIITGERYRSVVAVPPGGIVDADDMEASDGTAQPADPRIITTLIPGACIRRRVRALAGGIARDYPAGGVDLLVVLTGAFIFAADLARALYAAGMMDVRNHLVKLSTYKGEIKGAREEYRTVTLELAPGDMAGRNVLIVEDIVDQGFTLTYLTQYLRNKRAASVRICALVSKELDNPAAEVARLRRGLVLDYIGFTIPDIWIAGYGIDAAGDLRHLPDIVAVDETKYR